MASRRDELNAFTYARKRTVASFLKPLPNGSTESAPRPLKTVLPSIILGAVLVAGFGACGIIKPLAPKGWDKVGAGVIVGDKSTTRYVALTDKRDSKKQVVLHPVLNLASAKLLTLPDKFQVFKVKESEIDTKHPHGPAVGIPNAPDRLPDKTDAAEKKDWVLCRRPDAGKNSKGQQAVFVLGKGDKRLVEGKGKLTAKRAMYVQDEEKREYLVDRRGVAHPLGIPVDPKAPDAEKVAANRMLVRIIFGDVQPQPVSEQWMSTLVKSPVPITVPTVQGAGEPTSAPGVPRNHREIGDVVQADNGGEWQKYVVTKDGLQQVSDFVARMLIKGPNASAVNGPGGGEIKVEKVSQADIAPTGDQFLKKVPLDVPGLSADSMGVDNPWPSEEVTLANNFQEQGGNSVICSVYHSGDLTVGGAVQKRPDNNQPLPDVSMWAGDDFPAKLSAGQSTYVTPGSGLLYRQVEKAGDKSGRLFLVTDTGLRYAVPVNNDSVDRASKADKDQNQSQARLGYGTVHPLPIPKQWSQLLSAGPSLDTTSAKQPQVQ